MRDLLAGLTEVQLSHLAEAQGALAVGIAPTVGWWSSKAARREGRTRVQAVAAVQIAVRDPGRTLLLLDHAWECNSRVTELSLVAEVEKVIGYANAGGEFLLRRADRNPSRPGERAPRGAYVLSWRAPVLRRVKDALVEALR